MKYCFIFCSFLLYAVPAYGTEETLLLRCIANEEFNRKEGRYLIVEVNHELGQVRSFDHYPSGTTTYEYTLTLFDGAAIVGTRLNPQGDLEMLKLDRLSGRMTQKTDVAGDADNVWNDAKQRIGGFNLKPGQPLWLTATYECVATQKQF